MVMFREDEQRIIAAERAAQPRWKKNMRRVVKVFAVFAFMFATCLFVLSIVGGKSPALEEGIEQYLSGMTGYQADIVEFNGMEFFPQVQVDISGLRFTGESAGQVATIGTARLAVGFWDFLLGTRNVRYVEIQNMSVEPGIFGRGNLHVASAVIMPEDAPAFTVRGMYANVPLSLDLALVRKGRAFAVPRNAAFTLSLSGADLRGTLDHPFGGGLDIKIEDGKIADAAIHGDLELRRPLSGLNISGDINFPASQVRADITLDENNVATGMADVPAFMPSDLPAMKSFASLLFDLHILPPALVTNDEGLPVRIKNGEGRLYLTQDALTLRGTGAGEVKLPRADIAPVPEKAKGAP